MTIPYFEVAAFTTKPFSGNPAGVCILKEALPENLRQSIAAENNLAETAFVVPRGDGYELRWHTPTVEVDLCGHATLASAHVLWRELGAKNETLIFQSPRSGELRVTRASDRLVLDFPSQPVTPIAALPELIEALGRAPQSAHEGRDYLLLFATQAEVAELAPNFSLLLKNSKHGVIATAPGDDCDFVSRFFVPKLGIDEDPVTGSTHCALTPFWANRLGKKQLHARQISARGGELFCEDRGERVAIGGNAVTYLTGKIEVPE